MTATPQSRKRRGRESEHLVAKAFREHASGSWPDADAVGAGAPGRDVKGTPGIAVEVKGRREFMPMAALRQAVKNAGADIPIVVMRPTGGGPTNVYDWPAFCTLGQMLDLLDAALSGAVDAEQVHRSFYASQAYKDSTP